MKRKIKITEQQLNYIVENIVRKSKVNHKTSKAKYLKSLRQLNEETIDEEQLEEGVKEWLMIATMLFPSLSKAGAVEATKALNLTNQQKEMIMTAKGDVDKGDTYSMDKEDTGPRYKLSIGKNPNLIKDVLNKLIQGNNKLQTDDDGEYFLLNTSDFSMQNIETKLSSDAEKEVANLIVSDLKEAGYIQPNKGSRHDLSTDTSEFSGAMDLGGKTSDWQLTKGTSQDMKIYVSNVKDKKGRH
tara:strand:- start:624 stop:1349 length:726 start_codon:yes stop_codon:yes gene_type:complete